MHSEARWTRAVVLMAVLVAGGWPQAARALCRWTVEGKVQVKERETEGVDRTRPLHGVKVRVLASMLNSGGFVIWGTATTRADGTFRYETRRTCTSRKLRAQVRLDNSDLQVANPSGEDWMTIYTSPSKRGSGTLRIGSRTFANGAGGDLGNRGHVRRATSWSMVKTVMERLRNEDPWLAFDRKIHVRYPANTPGNTSYASGVTMTAYIDVHGSVDSWDADTVLHELMHLWNYQHNSGTTNWIDAVMQDGSTHGFQEEPNVAFHEGFAAWAKDELLYHVWGRTKQRPYSRYGQATLGLDDLDTLERSDKGVAGALQLLTAEDVFGLRFGTSRRNTVGTRARRVAVDPACPASPDLTVWDVLLAFRAKPGTRWNHDWYVGDPDAGLYTFFDRVTDVSNRFNRGHRNLYLALLDPEGSAEPTVVCGP